MNLWSLDPQYEYVDRKIIESCFELENRGFISRYFRNKQVTCDDYVIFVCFFLFYSNKDILTILLAMIGLKSNLFISKEQVDLFVSTYSLYMNGINDMDYLYAILSEYI